MAAALCVAATQAAGQSCAPSDKVMVRLAMVFGERLNGLGVLNSQTTIQTWVNYETGTWTILRVSAQGIACVIAAGKNWSSDQTPPGLPI